MDSLSEIVLKWEAVDMKSDEKDILSRPRRHLVHLVATNTPNEDGMDATGRRIQPIHLSSTVSEQVLQFERQKRKAEHAKKVAEQELPPLQVLYEDDDLVIVNKPSGVLTVPGIRRRSNSLLDQVYHKFADVAVTQKEHLIVHRLDMDTSGIVVFGKNLEATKELHRIFREREVLKEYEALLVGRFPSEEGTINLPLQRDHQFPPFMRVSTPQSEQEAATLLPQLQHRGWKKLVRQKPKPSVTDYRVVQRAFQGQLPYTRIRLRPVTGRTHQLRIHCAALGFAIVGDPTYGLYGESSPEGGLSDVLHGACDDMDYDLPSIELREAWMAQHPPNGKPMCLHAAALRFEHPTRPGEHVDIECPPQF